MKKIALLISLAALLVGSTCVLYAGSTIFGISGLIETPDDSIVAPNTLALSANHIPDMGGSDVSLNTFGLAYGLFPKLEISAAAVDSDISGDDTNWLLNAKYQLLSESLEKPSISVGVVDLGSEFDDDPSMFIVFGKNITAVAENISGDVSKPLRGTLGIGTGIYDGLFAGLNWSVAPKFNIGLEYLSDDSIVNAEVSYKAVGGLSLEAGLLDFDDFYVGAGYSLSTF